MSVGDLLLQDRVTDQTAAFDAHDFFTACKHLGLEPFVWQIGEQPLKISIGAMPLSEDATLVFRRIMASALLYDPDASVRLHYARTKWLARTDGETFVLLG